MRRRVDNLLDEYRDGMIAAILALTLLLAWRFWISHWPLHWFVIVAPAIPYVVLTLSYRRIVTRKIAEVDSRLAHDLKALYAKAHGAPSVQRSLQKFFHWTTYIAPVSVTCIIAMVFAGVGAGKLGLIGDLTPESARMVHAVSLPMLAGALGGYLWGLHDVVHRHGTADMSSTALHFTWLRIVVAAGVGAIIGSFDTTWGVAAAFVFATLRIGDIWTFLQKKVGISPDEGRAWESDLYLLEGLTIAARDRLIAEDIDSVQRLAFADPVRLLFRTNIEWNVILDLIDQALLVNYVGGKIVSLREIGVRGAIEIAELVERLAVPSSYEEPPTRREIDNAEGMLVEIGKRLGCGNDATYNLAYVLANDPLVEFVWQHYTAVYDENTGEQP